MKRERAGRRTSGVAHRASTRLWLAVATISISSVLFGYTFSSALSSVLGGPLADLCYAEEKPCPSGSIFHDIHFSSFSKTVAQMAFGLGAVVGAATVFSLTERWGQRWALLHLNVLFALGGALASMPTVAAVIVGRCFLGLAAGAEAAVAPILLAEIAHDAGRGKVVGMHQLGATVGAATAEIVGVFCAEVPHGWRWIQAIVALPAVVQVLAYSLVPESPRWLAQKQRSAEMKQCLLRHRCDGDGACATRAGIREEARAIRRGARRCSGGDARAHGAWREVFSRPKMMVVGAALMSMSALTGLRAVVVYSSEMFEVAGVGRSSVAAALIAMANVVATVVAAAFMDTTGRRRLLTQGIALSAASLVALASAVLGLQGWLMLQALIVLVTCLLFVAGYAIGFGVVSWCVVCEIVPAPLRPKAFGLFVACSFLADLFFTTVILKVMDLVHAGAQGAAALFLLLSCFAGLAYAFVYTTVQETMGQRLEDLRVTCLIGDDGLPATRDTFATPAPSPTPSEASESDADSVSSTLHPPPHVDDSEFNIEDPSPPPAGRQRPGKGARNGAYARLPAPMGSESELELVSRLGQQRRREGDVTGDLT